ncbi:MAG TPA: hypothetical protein VGR95_05710 [Thermoanaerobaculia bacterium]|nr:hypothetical protein [Thermoanaerobaculia bacterium]
MPLITRSSRIWATAIVVGLVVLLVVADFGYVEWRNWKVETVPLGATEAQVIAIMGEPETVGRGGFTPDCATSITRCYEWNVHNYYQYVCFGSDRRVICRGAYTVWT